MSRIPLAVASQPPVAELDRAGYVHLPGGWRLEWWIGADDQWHVPATSASLRQRRVENTPVVETVLRVPGGDVAWRVAATSTGDGAAVVAELHNRGAIPVAIGLALVEPATAQSGARPNLHFTAPARNVAAEGGIELLVHPVTHGTTFRCSIGDAAPAALPPIDAVVRGWQTLAGLGARVEFGDPTRDDALVAARTSLLLHSGLLAEQARRADRARAAHTASALTLLGYEDEAETVRLATRVRPARRGLPVVGERVAPAFTSDGLGLLADPSVAAATVAALRAELVDDSRRRRIDVVPGAAAAWRGRAVEVVGLPTNHGPVSFAVRWHGDHPALLWDAPRRVTLEAPTLAPGWSTRAPTGEELLTAAG